MLTLLGGLAFGQSVDWNTNIKNRPAGPPNQVVATNPSGSTNTTAYTRPLVAADIPALSYDASGAASTVQTNLNTEATTRASADTTNATAISTETTRAEGVEAGKAASNASTTVNGQTCTLGSPCTITTSVTTQQGITTNSGAITTTGVTTSQIPFNNPNALTSSMQIAVVPTTFAYTVPTNGVISGSTTMRNATSEMYLVSLPTASWTATIYRYPSATAGCLTSSPTSIGTVSVATSGAQTWSVTQTAFSIGDCLVLVAPSSVDASAVNPYGAIAVVD